MPILSIIESKSYILLLLGVVLLEWRRTNATQQTRNQICIKMYIKITNISVCQTDLLQGNINNCQFPIIYITLKKVCLTDRNIGSLYIFGFLFVVWRWFFFRSLLSTSTPVSRFRFIDLDPAAAVLVPGAYFFYIFYYYSYFRLRYQRQEK